MEVLAAEALAVEPHCPEPEVLELLDKEMLVALAVEPGIIRAAEVAVLVVVEETL
jgi:predicted metal-dependent TIM-barrel fold hydrolase